MTALIFGVSFFLFSCTEKENPAIQNQTPIKLTNEELKSTLENIYDNVSSGPQKVRTVHQLALLTSYCASVDGLGPISITPALFNEKEFTLVTLGGTQNVDGQATSMTESQLASFGKPNDYLYALVDLFKNGSIPSYKPVILTGISLGGMIAQQILGVQQVLDSHKIEAIITFGSPFTLPIERKDVKIVRFTDVCDEVPQMGEMIINKGWVSVEGYSKDELKKEVSKINSNECIYRKCRYTGMIAVHALSYVEDPCWNDVDFMGSKSKNNCIELTKPMKFYPAPKRN